LGRFKEILEGLNCNNKYSFLGEAGSVANDGVNCAEYLKFENILRYYKDLPKHKPLGYVRKVFFGRLDRLAWCPHGPPAKANCHAAAVRRRSRCCGKERYIGKVFAIDYACLPPWGDNYGVVRAALVFQKGLRF
jgi:hypothetical protein